MELCAGMVPMRDVKRPGPSLVYPLRPAGTFWQAHSLGIIDRSSHGCLANRFRRLGELALTILSLAPVQHWRRERRRVDIQSCWERRRKQRIGRHGGRWALTSCPSEFASTPPISWRAACLRRRRRRTRQQPSRSRSTAPPPATRRVKEGLRLSVRKPLCDGCDGRCRESRDSPYLMVYIRPVVETKPRRYCNTQFTVRPYFLSAKVDCGENEKCSTQRRRGEVSPPTEVKLRIHSGDIFL